MNIYYLCAAGQSRPLRVLDHTNGRVVRVRGGDWYAARAAAFDHALESGAHQCMIVAGHCKTYRVFRQDPTGRTLHKGTWPTEPSVEEDHHLINHTSRLLRECAGAVLVPPGRALDSIPWEGAYHLPTVPHVAAYSLAALQAVDHTDSRLGYNLSCAGFRVWTLGDFAHTAYGPNVLDEYGSATKWRKVHEEALAEYL